VAFTARPTHVVAALRCRDHTNILGGGGQPARLAPLQRDNCGARWDPRHARRFGLAIHSFFFAGRPGQASDHPSTFPLPTRSPSIITRVLIAGARPRIQRCTRVS